MKRKILLFLLILLLILPIFEPIALGVEEIVIEDVEEEQNEIEEQDEKIVEEVYNVLEMKEQALKIQDSENIESNLQLMASNEMTLATPDGLTWKEGSTATAIWNAVENANYYLVNVYVYNEGELLGYERTGTASNELDVQQEIIKILSGNGYTSFQVKFDVRAQYIDDSVIIESDYSITSSTLNITLKGNIKYETPTNIELDENLNASWSAISNVDYYQVYFYITYNGKTNSTWDLIAPREGTTSNGIFKYNLKSKIDYLYRTYGYNGENVQASFKVQAIPSILNSTYINSDYSEISNTMLYCNNTIIKYETPTNIELDENLNASWSAISNVDYYQVYFYITYNGKTNSTWDLIAPREGTTSNGIFKYNITRKINYLYRTYGYNGENVQVSFKVQAIPSINNSKYSQSDISLYSNNISYYKNDLIKYDIPTNLTLDGNCNASWSAISNVDYYKVYFYITYNGKTNSTWDLIAPREGTTSNGIFKYNITRKINYLYKTYVTTGETVEMSYKVSAYPSTDNLKYSQSDFSQVSNVSYYNPNGSTIINNIILSPNKPVLAIGRSMYIGKTIEPNNVFYDKINWSTSDNSIVSINNMGQITGIKKGNATVTAQINNATQNAEVSVYEIETNISNQEEANEVINEANNVIEAVTTDGDITNTDIEDKETVVNEIVQGAQNGDEFNVDIKYDDKKTNDYDNIKDKIHSKFDGYNIAGGNDIKIEISHTDRKGEEHHIANITELENDINIKFDMPTNIPGVPKNKEREYKLVRYHNEDIEVIDFEVNNGMVETSSDKFSDFVLLYKDIEIPIEDTTYSVIFKDYDGTQIGEQQIVKYGKNATAPSSPTRIGYTFIGWDNSLENIKEDITITAKYEINKYIVTFKDYDGTVLKTESVEYGKDATAPSNPTRNGYTFLNWDKSYSNVNEALTVTAIYSQNDNTYEVGRKRRKMISVSNSSYSSTYYNAVWKIDDTSIAKIYSTSKSSSIFGSYYNVVTGATVEGVKNGETYLRLYSQSGTLLKTFLISVINITDDISSCTISNIDNQNYTGSNIMPTVTIKNTDGIMLEKDIDYIIQYTNNIYPGIAILKVIGKDTYSGSVTKTFTINSNLADIDITPYMFNVIYYADMNKDLKNAFGYNEKLLREHYYSYGIKEGRKATPLFDCKYYLAKNSDLKNAFGNNYEMAYNHFINNGVKEGRVSSKYFNVKYYLDNNSDVKKVFSNNYTYGAMHFASNGIMEGRKSSEEFNIRDYCKGCSNYIKNKLGKEYIKYYAYSQGADLIVDNPIDITPYMFDADLYYNLYGDLRNAIGYNVEALRNHYYTYGINEGRIASYIFDAKYYLNENVDLQNAFGKNYRAAYEHFVNYGVKEGRQGSRLFSGKYYLQSYGDLDDVFGKNYTKAVEHFINYGINEKRIGSSLFNVSVYMNSNKDLKNTFKDNVEDYYKHYIMFGQKENRKCI